MSARDSISLILWLHTERNKAQSNNVEKEIITPVCLFSKGISFIFSNSLVKKDFPHDHNNMHLNSLAKPVAKLTNAGVFCNSIMALCNQCVW